MTSREERRQLQNMQRFKKELAKHGVMSKIKHTGSGNDSAAAPTHLSTLIMLIRHGETAWNLERRLQGQSDAPLNKTGAMQAQRVGVHVSSLGVQAVYSSDLSRAEDTAAAIARAASLPNVPTPILRVHVQQRLRIIL